MTDCRLIAPGLFVITLALAAATAAQQPVRRQGPPPKPFSSAELEAPVDVPMLAGEGVVVEVRLDGKGPYRFALDTGAAGGGRIGSALAESLGLPIVGEVVAGDPSGKNRETLKIAQARSLTLGGATFRDVSLTVRDLPRREGAAASEFDGVLGIGLFQDLLLTLDYPARRVRVEKGALPAADGVEVVDYSDRFGIPQIRLKVGDLEVDADVDSGNVNGVMALPASYLGKVSLEGEARVVGKARTGFNEFEIRQALLKGDVRIGAQVVEAPLVDFVEIFPHGNLGHGFLSRFALTIDQQHRRLRFHK